MGGALGGAAPWRGTGNQLYLWTDNADILAILDCRQTAVCLESDSCYSWINVQCNDIRSMLPRVAH